MQKCTHTITVIILSRIYTDPALDSLTVNLIRRFFRKVREYHRAYTGKELTKEIANMKKIMKQYKSHQRVSEAALEIVESTYL